jgi:hypothetical protein
MAYVTVTAAQAWTESSKLPIGSIDLELDAQVATQVLGRVASAYDTASWVDTPSTPKLIRSVMAMWYVSWLYDRAYSQDPDGSVYARRLRQWAEDLLKGIISGVIDLDDAVANNLEAGQPAFYPTDQGSAMDPTDDDPSLGPAKFTMGVVW